MMSTLASIPSLWTTYMLHPMHGNGYQWWSGAGANLGELSIVMTIVVAMLAWWRHHNCHVKRCPFLQWHSHPEHGHPVCRRHHPHEVSETGVNAADGGGDG